MDEPIFKDLNGQSLASDVDLFAKPNDGIGNVLYAYSDLKIGESFESANKKVKNRLPAWQMIFAPFFVLPLMVFSLSLAPIVIILFLALEAFAINSIFQKESLCVGYVGALGAELFQATGNRGNITSHQLLLFKDYNYLVRTIQNKYVRNSRGYNGAELYSTDYSSTDYKFIWANAAQASNTGEITITGTVYKEYNVNVGYPLNDLDNNRFNFCLQAEKAWTSHIWPEYYTQFRKQGFIEFNIGNQESVLLNAEGIELHERGEITRILFSDLVKATFTQNGYFLKLTGTELTEGVLMQRAAHIEVPLASLKNSELFMRFFYMLKAANTKKIN